MSGRDPSGRWFTDSEAVAFILGFGEGLYETFVEGKNNSLYEGFKAEQQHAENVATTFFERGDNYMAAGAGTLGIVLGDATGVTELYEAKTGTDLTTLAATGDYRELSAEERVDKSVSGGVKLFATVALPALMGEGGAAVTGVRPVSRAAPEVAAAARPQLSVASGTMGRGTRVALGTRQLTRAQADVLAQVEAGGGSAVFPKRAIKPGDLADFNAATECEYVLLTRGNQRMLIRGEYDTVNAVDVQRAQELAKDGWRWSAHVQPGFSAADLEASVGDRAVLEAFGQARSMILNTRGDRAVFDQSLWEVIAR